MCSGEAYSKAVSRMAILEGPHHQYEGMAGYIETKVEFEIRDITRFANLWESYYSLSDTKRLNLYGLAKGLGDCK
jgi:hypothetical protein